jgi:hypothetical protein
LQDERNDTIYTFWNTEYLKKNLCIQNAQSRTRKKFEVTKSFSKYHCLENVIMPVWALEVDKWARAFFWAGKYTINGGQCLVA